MSSSQVKPIKIWGRIGPNPPKVPMLLEELGIPYELIHVPFDKVKEPEYLAINPNGRLPAIYDPNTDITLWESGAILLYLVERYDTEHKLSFAPGTAEAAHAQQWLFFQASGQGPYYGQAVWFKKYHPEEVPSALERYAKEVARVSSLLENYLAKQKEAGVEEPWLVGGKLSYADLAFVPWQNMIGLSAGKSVYDPADYPLVTEWVGRVLARPGIKKALDETVAFMASLGPITKMKS